MSVLEADRRRGRVVEVGAVPGPDDELAFVEDRLEVRRTAMLEVVGAPFDDELAVRWGAGMRRKDAVAGAVREQVVPVRDHARGQARRR